MVAPLNALQASLQSLAPVGLLAAAGAWFAWRHGEARAAALRTELNGLTLNLFAPCLLFAVAVRAPLSREVLAVPLLLGAGMLAAGGLAYLLFYRSPLGRGVPRPRRAVLVLAAMFGNVLFIGLPVQTTVFGPGGATYAVFADILMATPLVWTLGVWVAVRLGGAAGQRASVVGALLRLPPVWAFAAGLALKALDRDAGVLTDAARLIGQATVPVTLFVLGLAVPWRRLRPDRAVLTAVTVKLLVMPLVVWGLAAWLAGPPRPLHAAAVLEAAMPTMLMAVVMAERFKLSVDTAALTVGWSSLLFALTLPLWLTLLNP